MCGMFSINGSPEKDDRTEGQTRIGIPLVDIGTGLYAVIAVLMALVERQRSGQGQFIDMTLYDAGIALMHPHLPNYLLSGKTPGLTGNAHPNISPYDKYPTKTVDIFLAVGNDRTFHRLCQALGAAELANDPRFRSNGDRVVNRDALTSALSALLKDKDGETLAAELLSKGVPAGPVRDLAETWNDAHTRHRRMAAIEDGACPSSFRERLARSSVHRRALASMAASFSPKPALMMTKSTSWLSRAWFLKTAAVDCFRTWLSPFTKNRPP